MHSLSYYGNGYQRRLAARASARGAWGRLWYCIRPLGVKVVCIDTPPRVAVYVYLFTVFARFMIAMRVINFIFRYSIALSNVWILLRRALCRQKTVLSYIRMLF